MKLWELIIITLALGGAVGMYSGFIYAWASGGDSVLFTFNQFHEQAFETVFFPLVSLVALVILLRHIRLLKRSK